MHYDETQLIKRCPSETKRLSYSRNYVQLISHTLYRYGDNNHNNNYIGGMQIDIMVSIYLFIRN